MTTHIVKNGEGKVRLLPGVAARRLVDDSAAGALDGLIVSEVTFLADTNPGHRHPEQEAFYFLEPVRVRLAEPEEEFELEAGDCLYVAPDRFHQVRSASELPARAVAVKTRSG